MLQTKILPLLPLLPTILHAFPTAQFPNYTIQSLVISVVAPPPNPHITLSTTPPQWTISFTVHDPAPAANAIATCTGTWDPTTPTTYPSAYQSCSDAPPGSEGQGQGQAGSFNWHFKNFTSIGEFTLEVKHSYMDERYDGIFSIVIALMGKMLTRLPNYSVGPCAVQPDGTLTYCGVTSWAGRLISAAGGDLSCDEGPSCSNVIAGTPKVLELPVTAAIA
ncbi:hypothetical protein EJ08DRAFT_701163 [Tothia fuscella]|uniref:Uncharacterized protein n=1 Tax=Tothia fuscella TaxID=1048955 RepID=A0A9P4NJ49_9PEZI|nr:hypothetical protein EJ08DRAFT_701163 [Tothia fuscella]